MTAKLKIFPTAVFLLAHITTLSKKIMDDNVDVLMNDSGVCESKNSPQLCPDGLSMFVPGVCYVLIENQTFPPSCPFKNFLPYHKIKFLFNLLNLHNSDIWIHATRNLTSGFGNYEWIERGEHYGQPLICNIDTSRFSSNKTCLFVQNGIFIPTECSTLYTAFCVYAYNMSQYCTKNNKNDACISAHFDFQNGGCYCKNQLQNPYPRKHETCTKLAEPKHQFQNFMLLHSFPNSDTCWFGLKKLNSTYFWMSSSLTLDYSYWSNQANCSLYEGALRIASDSGWTLLNDSTLTCSFCEVEVHPEDTHLYLYHDESNDVVNLEIHYSLGVSDWNGVPDIYCFSNANEDDFTYRLNLNVSSMITNSSVSVLQLPVIADYPGHYWCAAFKSFENSIVYSNTLVTNNRSRGYGYEYSLHLVLKTSGIYPLVNKVHVFTCNIILLALPQRHILSLRPLTAVNFNETTAQLEIIAHLTTKKSNEPHLEQYNKLRNKLMSINGSNPGIQVYEFTSTTVCFPENTTYDEDFLEWPETSIGATAIPTNKLCLDNNALPVTRKCRGNFLLGAKWLDVQGRCAKNMEFTELTEKLFNLLSSNISSSGVEETLSNITEKSKNMSVIDIYMVSRILETIAIDRNVNVEEFFKTINNIMNYDRTTLKYAQEILNSTDQVISSLDVFLAKLNGNYDYKSKNLLVNIIDLHLIESLTFVLRTTSNNTQDHFLSANISIVYDEIDLKDLAKDTSVELAIHISTKALNDIRRQICPSSSLKLIVAIFYKDCLFNEIKFTALDDFYQIADKVVSVSLTGFNGYLKSPIKMMFQRKYNKTKYSLCAFWDYGWDQLMISKYGKWVVETNNYSSTSKNSEFCEFYHTTHFSQMLIEAGVNIPKEHEKSLNILTGVGLVLSLIGIIPILVTAAVYKTWRRRPATIILVQLCITIALQTLLLFLNYLVSEEGGLCTIIGVGHHYLVLAEFCWMLVIGLLQYRKFVIILKPPPSNVLQKSAIIGWVLPLLPVFITLAISTENYAFLENKFCYPTKNYFLFFMAFPIILIFTANLYIFCRIFYAIYRVNSNSAIKIKNFKAEICLAILLFFVLGLTGIFAFISTVGGGIVFTYLYCITVSVRGFVLFLFFVIRDKEVKNLWLKETNNSQDLSVVSTEKRFSDVTIDNTSG